MNIMNDYITTTTAPYYNDVMIYDWRKLIVTERIVDGNESYWNVSIPTPGLTDKDITVNVKNSNLIISIAESAFTIEETFEWCFPYKLKPKMISTELLNGVLTISIAKPEDNEFSVEIN